MKYSLRLIPFLLSGFLQASAQSVSHQPASDANAWGDPVDGIQLRLTIPKDVQKDTAGGAIICVRPPSFVCGPPRLEMQMRNVGTDTATFNVLGLAHLSRVEIDGIWYAPSPVFGSWSLTGDLAPGEQSTIVPLSVQNHFFELDRKGAISDKRLDIKPGKHSVRVKTFDGSVGVHNSAHQVLTLVSNVLIIETSVAPATDSVVNGTKR